jgi:hypothetical protein
MQLKTRSYSRHNMAPSLPARIAPPPIQEWRASGFRRPLLPAAWLAVATPPKYCTFPLSHSVSPGCFLFCYEHLLPVSCVGCTGRHSPALSPCRTASKLMGAEDPDYKAATLRFSEGKHCSAARDMLLRRPFRAGNFAVFFFFFPFLFSGISPHTSLRRPELTVYPP